MDVVSKGDGPRLKERCGKSDSYASLVYTLAVYSIFIRKLVPDSITRWVKRCKKRWVLSKVLKALMVPFDYILV